MDDIRLRREEKHVIEIEEMAKRYTELQTDQRADDESKRYLKELLTN
jgi:hypothetical protein